MAMPPSVAPSLPDNKTCLRCGKTQPAHVFNPYAVTPQGLHKHCVACRTADHASVIGEMLDLLASDSPLAQNIMAAAEAVDARVAAFYADLLHAYGHQVRARAGARAPLRPIVDLLARRYGCTSRTVFRRLIRFEDIVLAVLSGATAEDMRARARELRRAEIWSLLHPERRAVTRHRRRAHENGLAGSFTAEDWRAVCAFYNNRCLRCGSAGPLTFDHVIPVVLDGRNDTSNCQPLCRSCNSSKRERSFDYRPHNI